MDADEDPLDEYIPSVVPAVEVEVAVPALTPQERLEKMKGAVKMVAGQLPGPDEQMPATFQEYLDA